MVAKTRKTRKSTQSTSVFFPTRALCPRRCSPSLNSISHSLIQSALDTSWSSSGMHPTRFMGPQALPACLLPSNISWMGHLLTLVLPPLRTHFSANKPSSCFERNSNISRYPQRTVTQPPMNTASPTQLFSTSNVDADSISWRNETSSLRCSATFTRRTILPSNTSLICCA